MSDLAAMRAGIAMRDETGHLGMAESGRFVLATYRDAAHFRLGGPNAARTKAKRAGWAAEPTNHPADPLHIRAVYEQCGEFSAAVELRRLFPAVTDTAQARARDRNIAGWKPLPDPLWPDCGTHD
jgi:hypothetical protein